MCLCPGERQGHPLALADAGSGPDGLSTADLIKIRENKNPSSFTCDCKIANKATKFSEQLTKSLADLAQCRLNSDGGADSQKKSKSKKVHQCATVKSTIHGWLV